MSFLTLLPMTSMAYNILKEPNVVSRDTNYIYGKPKNKVLYSPIYEKKLKNLGWLDIGVRQIKIIKILKQSEANDLILKIDKSFEILIRCIDELISEKNYEDAHGLIVLGMLNSSKNKELLDWFNMSAGHNYMLLAKQYEEKEDYMNSGLAYVYASLHFGRAGEKDLRLIALEKSYEAVKLRNR